LSSYLLPAVVKLKINKRVILPFVMYGFEIWSLTLCLKTQCPGKFGPKKDEISQQFRILYNEEQ
jgi:hypothetical protein